MTQIRVPIRQPRGWEDLVGAITAAPDAATFWQRMLELQIRVVMGDYGAIWTAGKEGPRLEALWPRSLGEGTSEGTEALKILESAARAGLERGVSQVLMMGSGGPEAGGNVHVFVTVMREAGANRAAAVATVAAGVRDAQVIAATAPMRELAAGLYAGFAARQEARAREEEARRIREALAVLAAVQEAQGFTGAALSLVNELARQGEYLRVSLGWVQGGVRGRVVKLIAVSGSDEVARRSPERPELEMAMAECLDQEQPIVYPVPEHAEPLLAQAVVFSHRRLEAKNKGRHILSLPVRAGAEWVGVLTLEHPQPVFDAGTIQRLQLIADVVGPQLADRWENDRWLIGHVWRSVRRTAAYVVGPKHVSWKLTAAAALVLLTVLTVGTWPYRVSARFRLEAHQKRVLPAMYEGRLARVLVQPGDSVQAGQLLAELDTHELELQRLEAQTRLEQARIERDRARAEGKQAEAARAEAQIRQIQARIDLLSDQIAQARIISPIDGVVLSGYWHDKIGSMLEQGTVLFEVAPLEELVAVLRVSESDVNLIGQELERLKQKEASGEKSGPTLRGELATRAQPAVTFPIVFDRLVPLARPEEGDNVFEVWCRLEKTASWLRPGMEGQARLEVGRRRIGWILTRRLIAALRLWLWW